MQDQAPPPQLPPASAHSLSRLTPPIYSKEPQLSSTTTPTCNPHTCRWRPYSKSNDFQANAAILIIVLFSALICALSLNAAIRCFLRGGGSRTQRSPPRLPQTQHEVEQRKPALEAAASALMVAPTLVYSTGLKLAGAEADCTICLSEFEEGESIQVLGRCKHGFHTQCIQQWLSSHTSCPTCRSSIFSSSPILKETASLSTTSASQPELPSMEP